jgi:hypothetical protein
MRLSNLHTRILVVAITTLGLFSCGGKKTCIDVSRPALDECRSEGDKLRKEIIDLKRTLAQALANPGTIKVDPSVLMVNGQLIKPNYKEGTLTQDQVIETMRQNKKVLKACYERAMKKNPALRRQTITLTVGFSVKPAGLPANISVSPNYDSMMIDCMRKAIMRWRFPPFTGQPVGVESPLTLTPKHR